MKTQTASVQDDTSPRQGSYRLFFGCFGRDAGSKKWVNRGHWGALLVGLSILAHFGLRGIVPESALDAATALCATAGIAIVYWMLWRYIQDLDELHQRIMFEALAFAFFATVTALVLAGVYGLSRGSRFNVLLIYFFAEIMRGVGVVLAARRYQ